MVEAKVAFAHCYHGGLDGFQLRCFGKHNMPIFEYYSPDTNTIYQFFARSQQQCGSVPRCPDGPEHRMERRVSSFAVTHGYGDDESEALGTYGPDDAKLEAAINQIEHEFRGIDESDPDPKQMARMMRRLQEVTGHRLPDTMQEMMGRLEAGEDPEALEASFTDQLDGEVEDFDLQAFLGEKGLRGMLNSQRGPRIDHNLYEMADYL